MTSADLTNEDHDLQLLVSNTWLDLVHVQLQKKQRILF